MLEKSLEIRELTSPTVVSLFWPTTHVCMTLLLWRDIRLLLAAVIFTVLDRNIGYKMDVKEGNEKER